MKNKHKKILIFNVNWLGDVLFSTATIRNIRYNFPDSYIACVIPPRCMSILEGNTYLDEIIEFDEEGRHKGLIGKLRFIESLRKIGFDMVYLLHRSASRAFICALAGIPERIGFYTKKRGFLLTKKISAPQQDSVHRIDYYLELIRKSGLQVRDRHTDFFIGEKDMDMVDALLEEELGSADGLIIGINPGGNWDPKRWKKELYSDLIKRLQGELKAKVVITGGLKDLELAREITRDLVDKPTITCGAVDIKQFAVLCKIFDVFITADTGPLHVANSVNTKRIIALFGPTDPRITGPYPSDNVTILQKSTGCKIPCYDLDCRDNVCMQAITVDDVMDAVNRDLGRKE